MNHDPKLASRWPASRVRRCLRRKLKKDLIGFLHDRYQERFFRPIRRLRKAEGNSQGYGIAVMSLCSLLVESIHCCRLGLPSTNAGELRSLRRCQVPKGYAVPKSEERSGPAVFCDFFTQYSSLFPDIDGAEFYRNVRNGLLHQAQTKDGWVIRVKQRKLCDFGRRVIDRNLFADALESAFQSYLAELRANDWKSDIWEKTRRKVWWLIRLSLASNAACA